MTESTSLSLPGLMPHAVQQRARVLEQRQVAKDTFFLRLHAPEIAATIVPGQFFMVRQVGGRDPLLGRPFALYDTLDDRGGSHDPATGLEFGYVIVGKLTALMSHWQPGDTVELWGPLGNGFPTIEVDHLLLVAGGIGQTPFRAVAREALGLRTYGSPPRTPARAKKVTLRYGVRSAEYLAGVDEFESLGVEVRVATDDGSAGHHGFVTELLEQSIREDRPAAVFCCGPEPMMHATAVFCARKGIDCWLSLESPMACGFGACFSCVTKVKVGDNWDYRRTCVEGPVFRADCLAQ